MKTIIAIAMLLVSGPVLAQQPTKSGSDDKTPHRSKFLTLNGIKVNYLDFGGKGEPLIFLAGMGDTAHVFDDMAPRFTDRYRVLAVTRRGFGDSDKPETGYEIANLTEDLRQFLDRLKVERAHFIGHSAAGKEILNFAALYPKRALKLVLLDAGYDHHEAPAIEARDPLSPPGPPKPWSEMSRRERIDDAFWREIAAYDPPYRKVASPVLSFYAYYEEHWDLKQNTPEDKRSEARHFIEEIVRPWQKRNIERFRHEVKFGEVILLRGTNHRFFLDPKKKEEVVTAVSDFLARR